MSVYDKYESVIGLECHIQLLTKTKMYSSDPAEYGALPNTNVSVITLGHPGTLPKVNGDYGLLQIVFDNLISNSIKFTSKKDFAIIEIEQCKNCNKECNMYIKDNGVGFDMSYANKLFGVFQRLHTESEFEGTGIGLANIKQIIQKHGGTIHTESEVDKGTTFFISI